MLVPPPRVNPLLLCSSDQFGLARTPAAVCFLQWNKGVNIMLDTLATQEHKSKLSFPREV